MNDDRPQEGQGSPADGGSSGERPKTRRELREAERRASEPAAPVLPRKFDVEVGVDRPTRAPSFDELFGEVEPKEAVHAEGAEAVRPLRRPPSAASPIIGVGGEVLITVGVLALLFIGWRLWWEGLALNANQDRDAAGLSQQWATAGPLPTSTSAASGTTTPTSASVLNASMNGEPVVRSSDGLEDGTKFAVLYVPRFGDDFKKTISEGVDPKLVLNGGGAGHYDQTAMPGAVGNFAIAAHRDGWGSPFLKINELQVGDPIYVETQDGFYTYQFRGTEYVDPYGVGVLDPVPQAAGASPTDRFITLTSCNPLYIASERIVAYGVLVGWQPRTPGAPAGGAPSQIANLVAAG